MAKTKRIEGLFIYNLWNLVLENADLGRFRELFEIKPQNADLLSPDKRTKPAETIFDFCRKHSDYKQVYTFLYKRLSAEQKRKIGPWKASE